MRAESLKRSLGQLRQDHRAAEMHPSVARPRVSVILVTPASPPFAVVLERIIQARIAAGFGNDCRLPWLGIQNDGFKDFTGILWLKEHWSMSGSVLCIDQIRLCYIHTPRTSGRLGVLWSTILCCNLTVIAGQLSLNECWPAPEISKITHVPTWTYLCTSSQLLLWHSTSHWKSRPSISNPRQPRGGLSVVSIGARQFLRCGDAWIVSQCHWEDGDRCGNYKARTRDSKTGYCKLLPLQYLPRVYVKILGQSW